MIAAACGGGGGSGGGGNGGGGDGGGVPSCSNLASAGDCGTATFGYPTSHTAAISSSHTLVSVDGASSSFVSADTNMQPGACADDYSCGGNTWTLSWGSHSYPAIWSWTIGSSFATCSGGGGGCAGKCSSCLDSCRGYSGCCCGSGCMCESECTSSCGDNCGRGRRPGRPRRPLASKRGANLSTNRREPIHGVPSSSRA